MNSKQFRFHSVRPNLHTIKNSMGDICNYFGLFATHNFTNCSVRDERRDTANSRFFQTTFGHFFEVTTSTHADHMATRYILHNEAKCFLKKPFFSFICDLIKLYCYIPFIFNIHIFHCVNCKFIAYSNPFLENIKPLLDRI